MKKTGQTTKDNRIYVLTFSGKQNKYFCNLRVKDLNGNKKFWKKIKPFFSDKGLQTNNILKDKNRLVTDSSIIANSFNNYFINIIDTVNLKLFLSKSKSLSDLLKLYEDHFCALKIKGKCKIQNKFQFKEVSPDEVRKIIQSLNMKKSAITSCIPVKHLTESVDIYLPFLTDIINHSLKNGIFPDELKLAQVIPLFVKLIHLIK